MKSITRKVTQRLIAAALFAACGAGAFAQEATTDTWINAWATSHSRAQVQLELDEAHKDGSIASGSIGYDFVGRSVAMKTRQQVRAELIAARASGEYDTLNGEAYSFNRVPRTPVYAKHAAQ